MEKLQALDAVISIWESAVILSLIINAQQHGIYENITNKIKLLSCTEGIRDNRIQRSTKDGCTGYRWCFSNVIINDTFLSQCKVRLVDTPHDTAGINHLTVAVYTLGT